MSREPCPPRHDIFCFLKGPAVGELLQEFQWRWGKETHQHLEIQNTPASTKTGQTRIEIAHTAPGGRKDILKAYLVAIAQAKRYIYLENQYFVSRTITSAISERLCQRPDLKVIIVLPDKAEDFIVGPAIARIQYRAFAWMKKVAKNVNRSEDRVHIFALKRWNPKANENIGFLKRAGVYWLAKAGIDISQSYLNWMLQKQEYTSIYVHAKIGIIDDQWMTIGSANISPRSFELDTELNVFLDDAEQATNFRTALWGEHLEKEECEVEDIDKTIALMVSTATANSQKESGDLDGRLVLLESAPPPMNYLLGFLYKSLAEEFL